MERRATPASLRKRRRRITYLWVFIVAVIIITLVETGQEALLYVLATVSVTVLLVIVARADLNNTRRTAIESPPPFDDSASIADHASASSAPSARSSAPRGVKRR